MTTPKPPRPPQAPPLDSADPTAQERVPDNVGTALMRADGTLELHLRCEETSGTIAEALLIVAPSDARYADMVKHLGGITPGHGCAIPPFPDLG